MKTLKTFITVTAACAYFIGYTQNTRLGSGALPNNNGTYNTAIGYRSMYLNTSGYFNTATGAQSMYSNTTGNHNAAYGRYSLFSNTVGVHNTASGAYSLYLNTSGFSNTATGFDAMYNNDNGCYNTGMGMYSLNKNTGGFYNSATGYAALYTNTGGSRNTANGYQSLYKSTGSGNTAVGQNSLYQNITGMNNTALGATADVVSSNLINATAIGAGAKVDASNKVRIGNAAVTSIGGQVGWTIFSDGRFKANVKENVAGLAFIKALRPVTYNLDAKGLNARYKAAQAISGDEDATLKTEDAEMQKATDAAGRVVYSGFIAQEVEAAAQKLNYDFSGIDKPQSKDGLYGLRYDNFIVPLVKAVQELAQQNDALKDENKALQNRLARLEEKINNAITSATSEKAVIATTGIGTSLEQNRPNPFSNATVIRYHMPASVQNAQLLITNAAGVAVKSFSLSHSQGNGQVSINAGELAAGNYFCTLIADGKKADTKQITLIK